MENKLESIDDVLYTATGDQIARRRKTPFVSLLVGVAGCVLTVWSLSASSLAENANLSSMLMLVGGIVALVGFIKAGVSFASSYPVYKPTGERIRRCELFYDTAKKRDLCAAFEAADMEKLARIPRSSSTSGVLMTVYKTDSGSFTMVQVLEYIPHAFEPVTGVAQFTAEQARAVAALV